MKYQKPSIALSNIARSNAGGAATAGGMNFQAAVTAIAYVYMLRGQSLSWLEGVVDDVPVAIEAETGGSGDDIRLLLRAGEVVEVQVKKGLQSGDELWDALTKLAIAKDAKIIDYGVLIVSSTSSGTVTRDLARDIARLGDGRSDGLSDIAQRFVEKLNGLNLPVAESCKFLRIHVVSATRWDQASIQAARAELAHLCEDQTQVAGALKELYIDAGSLIENRGRRDVSLALRVLRTGGIKLAQKGSASPMLLLERLSNWTIVISSEFSIFGVRKKLRTEESWIKLRAVAGTVDEGKSQGLADALKAYQEWEERAVPRDAAVVDPETLCRFITRAILVGGPGMGKTTLLKRIANRYSEDRIPVLNVRLAAVAARMQMGSTFEESVFELGLDGSGISASAAKTAMFPNWVLLCDGLDECGKLQESVASGVARFATGHPDCRVLVTTRPVGYDTAHFEDWKHYWLAPLETSTAASNLATLVVACVSEDSPLRKDAFTVCDSALDAKETSNVVARSPLLLGLAASIIAHGGHLGSTKVQLYEQIFGLIDDVPNFRSPEPPAEAIVLQRYLDILGWQVTAHPLNPINATLELCGQEILNDTGKKPLQARADAHTYLNYWQDVGMVEKLGHGNDEALAFIHKSFGEFAAARFLRLNAPEERTSTIIDIVDRPEWNEIIRFAGNMGMASDIAKILLSGPTDSSNGAKRIVHAIGLLAEANPAPEVSLRDSIISAAFKIIASSRRWQALDVAEKLVMAAHRFPDEIGPFARSLLDDDQSWTHLAAWAIAVTAGPNYYRMSDLADVLRATVSVARPGMVRGPDGGIQLRTFDERDLSHTFALKAISELLDRNPSESTDAIIQEVINHKNFGSVGFHRKAQKLFNSKGRTFQFESEEKYDFPFKLFPEGYDEARAATYEAIFDALDLPDAFEKDEIPGRALLHFSAFLSSSGFMQMPMSDVWAWTEQFDRSAVRETLKGFVGVCGIDLDGLRRDAQRFKHHLMASPLEESNWFFDLTTDVDPPVVNWAGARSLGLDTKRIEESLHHPSEWIVTLGLNLIENLMEAPELPLIVSRLFDEGRGHTLWAASRLATMMEREQAIRLLFERLGKPLVYGCGYLYALLRLLEPGLGVDLLRVARAGLFGKVLIAKHAAELVLSVTKFESPSSHEMANIICDALTYWVENEEPYPVGDGVVPDSPRATLLQALAQIRPLSESEIKACIADSRSDVKDVGTEKLIESLLVPDRSREEFLLDIRNKILPPTILGKALKKSIPLSASEFAICEGLLTHEDAAVRWSAMAMLSEDYMDIETICRHAKMLVRDEEQQIKERAFRLLEHAEKR